MLYTCSGGSTGEIHVCCIPVVEVALERFMCVVYL